MNKNNRKLTPAELNEWYQSLSPELKTKRVLQIKNLKRIEEKYGNSEESNLAKQFKEEERIPMNNSSRSPMKTTEEYLIDYFAKKRDLERKGELWRLRVTLEEFLSKLEIIMADTIENKKSKYFTEYHIQRNEEAQVEVMLMDKMTLEEMQEQGNRLRKESERQFAEEAPEVQAQLKLIQTPLCFEDARYIYRGLFRKQITIDLIPKEVFKEFKNTKQYKYLLGRKIIESEKEGNI